MICTHFLGTTNTTIDKVSNKTHLARDIKSALQMMGAESQLIVVCEREVAFLHNILIG